MQLLCWVIHLPLRRIFLEPRQIKILDLLLLYLCDVIYSTLPHRLCVFSLIIASCSIDCVCSLLL